ncbi:MAG: SRPBCC domain-containing protein [Robiginitomaculum sp.]|nr:SRPBCC domain-containing protein [Robiginitomaculum sp.]
MKNTQLVKTIFINSDPDTVWQHLTDKDKLGEWFHPSANDLKANTDYQLLNDKGGKICWGRVTEYEVPKRLVYTFTHNHLKGVESIVVWELSSVHGGTKLVLTHSGFEAANTNTFDLLIDHDKGWDDHFSRLREKACTKP